MNRHQLLSAIAIVALLLSASTANALNVVRAFTGLTGNTTGTVDAIDIADLVNGDIGIATTGNVTYFYQYNSSATDATASPYFIRPHDYSSAGVWYLRIEGTGNFNDDGYMDIIWRYYGEGAYKGLNDIWYMQGTSYIGEEVFSHIPVTSWRIVNL